MDVQRIVIGAMLVVLWLTPGFALARGGGGSFWLPQHKRSTSPDRDSRMQRHDMRQACQKNGQAMTPAIEQLTAKMQQAMESNDLVQIRAVLAQAQQQLTAVKDYIGRCVPLLRQDAAETWGPGEPQVKAMTLHGSRTGEGASW